MPKHRSGHATVAMALSQGVAAMGYPLKAHLETRDDVDDFVNGLAFLATGGGGPMEDGRELLTSELEAGREVGWIDISVLPGDALTVTLTRSGGPPGKDGPPSAEELALYGLKEPDVHGNEGGGGQPRVNRQMVAVRELEKHMGAKFSAVIGVEVGAGNLAGALVTALRLGIPTIDGDHAGRAVPEMGNSKTAILGARPEPICYVDRWNNIAILKQVGGAAMADRIARHLGIASFGRLGMAAYLMPAREAKATMVLNTLSLAYEVGKVIRRGRIQGRPIEALIKKTAGWLLFKGRVTRVEWEAKGAYQHYYGTHHFEGIDEFSGKRLRKWFKNENHVVFLNDEPLVTSPDCINVVDLRTGIPVINLDIREGQELAVIGMMAPDPVYRTPAGLAAFSARHFGFDIDYVPIEKKLGPGGRTTAGA